MTKRKSTSPREILSRFDDAARHKKTGGQSSPDDMSIFNVVPTQDQDGGQSPEGAAVRKPPNRGEPPRPTAKGQAKRAPKHLHWRPSWEVAEAAQNKRSEINSQPTSCQSSLSASEAGIKVGTIRRKATRGLLAVLVVVLIYFVIQGFFADIEGFVAERIVAGGGLRVKGILYDKGNSSALVNKQIVREGDKISGATVIRINRDSVEFEVTERWPREGQRRVTKKVHR